MRPTAYLQHHVMGEDDLVFTKDEHFDHTPLFTRQQLPKPSERAILAARRILAPHVATNSKDYTEDLNLLALEILRLAGKRK
jgi:hypothetical protein